MRNESEFRKRLGPTVGKLRTTSDTKTPDYQVGQSPPNFKRRNVRSGSTVHRLRKCHQSSPQREVASWLGRILVQGKMCSSLMVQLRNPTRISTGEKFFIHGTLGSLAQCGSAKRWLREGVAVFLPRTLPRRACRKSRDRCSTRLLSSQTSDNHNVAYRNSALSCRINRINITS
jgi:hypothetical protein